ncbi:MAG TPA: TonB family protein [Pseudolabrys sp.]|nr:TonB family protein [Pseudolabrys sp.]
MSATAILPSLRGSRSDLLRWSVAGALVLAAHLAIAAGFFLLRPLQVQGVEEAPAVIIELAPLTVAPTPQVQDLAPGPPTPPPQTQAQAEPHRREAVETPKTEITAKIEPAPVAPLVTLPEPKPPAPPEAKPETKPEPKPEQKPLDRRKETSRPSPAQTAPPKTRQAARKPAAARAGSQSQSSVAPSWISRLLAHLNRYKRRPDNTGGEQGVVMLAFTVSRDGRVLARHIARSSSLSAFDAEALAMLRRAEPLPPFPDSMSGRSRSFNVPIRFSAQ